MHKDVLWFDTAACWSGKFIGEVNSVTVTPDASVNIQYPTDPSKTYTANPASDANPALNGVIDASGAVGTFVGGWYTGANYSDQSPSKDYNNDPAYNKLVAPKDANGPFQTNWKATPVTNSAGTTVTVYQKEASWRSSAWDVDLSVAGKIDWANNDLT